MRKVIVVWMALLGAALLGHVAYERAIAQGGMLLLQAGGTTGTPVVSCSQSTAFIARALSADASYPTNYQNAAAVLLCGLETDGVGCSSTIDVLYLTVSSSAAVAALNLCSASFPLTTSGTITFTAGAGYTGNGTNGYLDTNWTPSTDAVFFALNDASFGIYVGGSRTTGADTTPMGCGSSANSGFTAIFQRSMLDETGFYLNMFPTSTAFSYTGNANGMWVVDRSASNAMGVYRNSSGTALSTSTNGSGVVCNFSMVLSAGRENTGSPINYYTDDPIYGAYAGKHVTSANAVKIMDRFNTYMTTFGVNKY